MRCRDCDAPNPPERKTCSKCGAKLPPPPGREAVAAEAPRAKPRPRPEPDDDEDEEEERPRRRPPAARDDEDERRPRRRPAPADYDDEDDEFEDEEESGVARVIPFHNKPALIGYYLAILSLVPAVMYPVVLCTGRAYLHIEEAVPPLHWLLPLPGLLLGAAGMTLGVIGIVRGRSDAQARGVGHAGTALFLGLLTFLVSAICWILRFMDVLPMEVF